VAADRYAEAAKALRAGLERDRDSGTWTARMRLVRGELRARQEDWVEAETALEAGVEGSLPDDVGERAAFLLGQVRETLEKYEEAQRAYERVLEFDPPYSLEFEARLGAIEMQGIRGQPQRALQRLEDLRREDDTNAMRGQIAIVRARLYQVMDRPQDAHDALTAMLWGEDAPTGTIQGRLHYDLATLYRDTYEDFSQAAAHFDTAATNLSSASGQRGLDAGRDARALPSAPSDAGAQSERFQGLAERAQAVARMDSLLRLGEMPKSELQSVVEKIRQKRLKEQKKEAEAQRQRQQQFGGGRQQSPGRRNQSGPSQQNVVQTQGSDAGFLFHRDPTLVQQGRRQFEQTWGDRPLVDNWRRVDAIQGGEQQAAAPEAAGRGPEQSGEQEASEQVVDLSAVPRDSASQAEMEADRAVARYELANALFRAAGRPDSAATWFRRVLDEDRNHPVARQALYGLAQAQWSRGDTTAAEETSRRLIEEYPGTPYARRARQQLGREEAEPSADGAASRADSAYAEAYDAWQRGPPDRALHAFMEVARTYPDTKTAPRALLAAGVVYRRSAQEDSSDQLQTQFEQYVDSLAQSSTDSTAASTPESDSMRSSRRGAPSKERAPGDTSTGQEPPQRAADTTAAQTSPERPPASPEQRPDATEDTSRAARLDSSARRPGAPQRPSLRRVDTTEQSSRERPRRAADSTEAVSPSQQADTLAPAAADDAPDSTDDSTEAPQTVPVDSTQSPSESEGPSDSFEGLLTYLTEQYGDTPAATRAQSLLDHMKRQQSTADSTKRPSEQSTPSDSAQVSPRPDSVALPDSATSDMERAASDTTTRRRPPDTTRTRPDLRRRPVRRDTSSVPARAPDSTRQRPSVHPSAPDTTGGDG
jgi:tetratricopeptide (TPR) repeat protein